MAVFDNSLHVTWAGEACSGPPDSSVNGSTWPSQPHRAPTHLFLGAAHPCCLLVGRLTLGLISVSLK